MVDFPARHVCGSIRLASVYICSTMCKNWFYNLYHQLWWMGKSQKSRGREGTFFYIKFWLMIFVKRKSHFWPHRCPFLMVKSRCVLQFSPHFLLNTSNVARLPHMGLKKKIVPQPQIHFVHEDTKKIALKYLLWFLYPMVLTSPSLTKAASQRAQARGVAAPVVPKDVEARWVGRELAMGWYGYGSIPINTIFRGMNIHLPAILMFTRGTRFWHTAICYEIMSEYVGLTKRKGILMLIFIWI